VAIYLESRRCSLSVGLISTPTEQLNARQMTCLVGMVFGMEWNGARRLFDRRRAWLPTNPQRFSRRETNPSIHLLIISLLECDIQDQEFMMPERVGHHLSYQGVCSDPMARTGCANKLAVQQLIGHDYAY
jgi:hypothetical protein